MIKQTETDSVVVGRPVSRPLRPKTNKTKLLIIAAVLLLIAAVAVQAYHVHVQHQNDAKALAAIQDKQLYDTAYEGYTTNKSQRKYDEAIAAAQAYVVDGADASKVARMLVFQGTLYEIKRDNHSALTAYKQAEAKSPKEVYAIDRGIATTSYILGDKPTALTYFKKSLVMLQAMNKDQSLDPDIEGVQSVIKTLESEV